MARGLSPDTCFCRKARIRRDVWWSSLLISRLAPGSSSTFHAMPPQDIFKRNGLRLPRTNVVQTTLGKSQILEIVQIRKEGLAGMKGFGFSCAHRQTRKAFLKIGRKVKRGFGIGGASVAGSVWDNKRASVAAQVKN